MNSTKEDLVKTIKEWITIENEIKKLQQDIKERKCKKKELSDTLVNTMKSNEIDCFDINDGKIIYTRNKVRSTVSKKHITDSLSQYFNDSDVTTAQDITKFILDNRSVAFKDNIKFKEPKK